MAEKEHFVLVHGSGHGPWCWYKLRCLLENSGHLVTCIDLAGAGIDSSDPNYVLRFEDYNRPLLDFMSNLPEAEKVVLVGHSAGGLSVTQAVHQFSTKVAVAVYVAANMLRNGFCTEEDFKAALPQPHSGYGDPKDMKTSKGILRDDLQRKILYNTSPKEDQILASMLLRPSPPGTIFLAPRFNKGGEADKVRRVYVKALYDQVVSCEQQDMMIKLWPPSQVFTLESDHSPFFSVPTQLCDLLLKVASSSSQVM